MAASSSFITRSFSLSRGSPGGKAATLVKALEEFFAKALPSQKEVDELQSALCDEDDVCEGAPSRALLKRSVSLPEFGRDRGAFAPRSLVSRLNEF